MSGQVRPTQADGVVRLLTDLEVALGSNSIDEFARLAASTLPPAEGAAFVSSSFREGQGFAAVRERDRRPEGPGFKVLVEMLLGRGGAGHIATWQLLVRPKADDPDRFEVAGATPVASVDGLVKLELDTTRQFVARDLVFSSQGLTLHLSSGTVFLTQVEGGSTALIFRGRGSMRFSPEDPAEQVQVRAFSGRPTLETPVESLLIRISPQDFNDRFGTSKLVPVAVNPGDGARARSLFDELSTKSYTLSLGDLTSER
ncbi:MAG: hypothetical protein EXQ49_12880 [Acidobacteria bacterium]|nr:hypothetical protein [Acidobacteriota bacterium]